MDVTKNNIQDEDDLSENKYVHLVYGEIGLDVQGPAGSRVPDEDEQPPSKSYFEDETEMDDVDDDDAEPGSFTVGDLMNDEQALAASIAGAKVHGSNTTAMLDAMEHAEEQYNNNNNNNQPYYGIDSSAAPIGAHQESFDNLRARVVDKLAESLIQNPCFITDDTRKAAEEIEHSLFTNTHSKAVYQSVASNAVRIARQQHVKSVAGLVRVTTGNPQVPGQGGADDDVMKDSSGLQEYTLKEET